MDHRLYTIVCEFRGGTYVSQVHAGDVGEAVQTWSRLLAEERPIPKCSSYLAKRISASLNDEPPTPLNTLSDVWCIFSHCGGDQMLANIIGSSCKDERSGRDLSPT